MGADRYATADAEVNENGMTAETETTTPPPAVVAETPGPQSTTPAAELETAVPCQSCGRPLGDDNFPVLSAGGTGLNVCPTCASILSTIGWEIISTDPVTPA